jgi:hypothetical protein
VHSGQQPSRYATQIDPGGRPERHRIKRGVTHVNGEYIAGRGENAAWLKGAAALAEADALHGQRLAPDPSHRAQFQRLDPAKGLDR